MSYEKVQIFFDKVKNSPDLQEKVREAKQQGLPERAVTLSALSEEAGTPFTSEEFVAAVGQARTLTESELQGISGGTQTNGCVPCFG